MKPTFRRIAISAPPVLNNYASAQAWIDYATNQGADALLLRSSIAITNQSIIELICGAGLPVLLNLPKYFHHPSVVGIHLKDSTLPFERNSEFQFYGKSCHDFTGIQQAIDAGIDYVFFSPIFPTHSHPNQLVKGLRQLKEACKLSSIPVFALGGITAQTEDDCLKAGAFGIAAISWFLPPKLRSDAFYS
ncbi:MAG: thiamine phosphate synthase [Bacteroidia bacterium]|nr:thiamine phosphate synthase [Bacteroidia bacterium]